VWVCVLRKRGRGVQQRIRCSRLDMQYTCKAQNIDLNFTHAPTRSCSVTHLSHAFSLNCDRQALHNPFCVGVYIYFDNARSCRHCTTDVICVFECWCSIRRVRRSRKVAGQGVGGRERGLEGQRGKGREGEEKSGAMHIVTVIT